MKPFFYSLSSGSSGNCYYLGTKKKGILIDAGISAKSIKKFLGEINIDMSSIMGILISHNHIDHIKGLQSLTKKYHIPVFTTEKVWKSIITKKHFNDIDYGCMKYIVEKEPFKMADFFITGFRISHDSPETLGFHLSNAQNKITVATDLGYICPDASSFIKISDFLVIESNYDEQMLLNSKYPAFLKNRIIGKKGHLDNNETSDFLAEIMSEKINHICLAHLSQQNNSPEIALSTLNAKLSNKNADIEKAPLIHVLKRNLPTEKIFL